MIERPEHVERALREPVEIVPYDPAWPASFAAEAARLRALLPAELIGRIEHFGSTAVPGLAAKPIVDMLLEVRSLREAVSVIAPLLQAQGYEFFWRVEEHGLPEVNYAWFIKRDARGRRTHHIHCLEPGSSQWQRLQFRDYLVAHPALALEYDTLKRDIAARFPHDRIAYAKAKTAFIERVTAAAQREHDNQET